MTLTSANVRVAVSGAIYVGPTATAAPTATDSVLAVGFVDLGYVHEDGVTETRDRTTEKLKAWQGAAVIRETVTESSMKYECTLIETSAATIEAYYSAAPVAGVVDIDPGDTGGRKSFVLDIVDGTELIRAYLPTAEITEVGEQVYSNGEPIGYPITITAYPGVGGYSVRKFYGSLEP